MIFSNKMLIENILLATGKQEKINVHFNIVCVICCSRVISETFRHLNYYYKINIALKYQIKWHL